MARKLRPHKRKWALFLALLLLLAIAGGVFLHLHRSNPVVSWLLSRVGLAAGSVGDGSYLFPKGTASVFALSGGNLAVASSTTQQLLTLDGELIAERSALLAEPAIAASRAGAVFYDVGGLSAMIVDPQGVWTALTTEQRIYFADLNNSGYITVSTEHPGYRGRIQVFDAYFRSLFTYDCGESGYPVCARTSDSGILAVNCVSSSGSVLHFFSLNSEHERGEYATPGVLIYDIVFLTDGTLAAVTDSSLLLLTDRGEAIAEISYDGRRLRDYCCTGSFVALLLLDGRSGSNGVLRTVGRDGQTLGELTTDRAVSGLSAAAGQLLVQYEDELTLYSDDLEDDISYQRIQNVKRALLTEDGCAVLLGNYGVRLLHFR